MGGLIETQFAMFANTPEAVSSMSESRSMPSHETSTHSAMLANISETSSDVAGA